ncbi:hypothetical protein DPMN_133147 [Dreissena polymorpha]|uniref:Uncharacterized protein n=1 Tax=Dreissena polymorpha TaxID=45954 RepID=A0A9D4FXX1_DREPO|nr:hypothetical protein DPMN_133147 [Dreissena polymorpha]
MGSSCMDVMILMVAGEESDTGPPRRDHSSTNGYQNPYHRPLGSNSDVLVFRRYIPVRKALLRDSGNCPRTHCFNIHRGHKTID